MLNTMTPVARTPLHDWHAAHGARFAHREGWQTVAAYAAPERETEVARAGLGLADISAFAKMSLRGPGASALVASFFPGQVTQPPRWAAVVPATGAISCRLHDEHFLMLPSTPMAKPVADPPVGLYNGRTVLQIDETSAFAGFWLIGAQGADLVCHLTSLDLRPAAFPVNSCAETALASVEALLIRTDDLPVPSLRIYVAWDLGEFVWERVLEAGHDRGITPVGMDALARLGVPGSPV
jgi:sarcosine oxidase subunit alpha